MITVNKTQHTWGGQNGSQIKALLRKVNKMKTWFGCMILRWILCEQILQNRYSTWDRILHTHMPSNMVPKCSVPLAAPASVQSKMNRCAAWPMFATIPRKFCNDIVSFECPRHMLHYTLTNVNLSWNCMKWKERDEGSNETVKMHYVQDFQQNFFDRKWTKKKK